MPLKRAFIQTVENKKIRIISVRRSRKIAEENPTMSFQLIKEILFGLEELDRGI